MTYRIEWKPSALREFKKLPPEAQRMVERQVTRLENEPRPEDCRKLAGFDNAYRLRLGAYRLVYEVEDKSVRV